MRIVRHDRPRPITKILSLAWALTAFATVAQVASAAHLLLERHAFCAEHGELIHTDGRPAAAAPGAESAGAAVASDQAGPSARSHEHCSVALERRERSGLAAQRAEIAPPCTQSELSPACAFGPRLAVEALFRLAPKNSPPAA